jgi:membrane fusion protein (multidrug efflux system)
MKLVNKTSVVVSLISVALLSGCGDSTSSQTEAPLPLVKVEQTSVISYKANKSYVGRIEAMEDTAIVAQVTGYLTSRHFKDGQTVEKDQLLYQIEPASYEAQVASAKAAVAQAEASVKQTTNDFERAEELLPKGSISQAEYDNRLAANLGSIAQLEAAKAQLTAADVSLSYTQIKAPFAGRIDSTSVSIGDLLSPSVGELTTVVSMDPIHATFQISERERIEMGLDRYSGDVSQSTETPDVTIILENDEEHEEIGRLNFIGNRVDLNTGTIALRALIPNPNHTLLPGQNIRVKISSENATDVIVIPRRAVQTDIEGDFIMLVSEGNVAERRLVELGASVEGGVIIKTGLSETDKVIVEGLQRVRNGMPVRIESK